MKTHIHGLTVPIFEIVYKWTACGRQYAPKNGGYQVTKDPKAVTCKACMKRCQYKDAVELAKTKLNF